MIDTQNPEADRLNDRWDAGSLSADESLFAGVARQLATASMYDVPPPATEFVANLRRDLVEQRRLVAPTPSEAALGIMTWPLPARRPIRSMRRTWMAVAAAVVFALAVSGFSLSDSGQPSLNSATARSSEIAQSPTATVTILPVRTVVH